MSSYIVTPITIQEIHYFDFVCCVLGKVALEPQLIEVEADQDQMADLDRNQFLKMFNMDTSFDLAMVISNLY